MFKKILLAVTAVLVFANFAFAAVEANSADKAGLDSVKSIGEKTADAIIAERTKNGKFKDWNDFIHRVKGVGPGNAAKMSGAGLTVNGTVLANAPAAGVSEKKTTKATQPASAPVAAAPADKKTVAVVPVATPKLDDKKKEKK